MRSLNLKLRPPTLCRYVECVCCISSLRNNIIIFSFSYFSVPLLLYVPTSSVQLYVWVQCIVRSPYPSRCVCNVYLVLCVPLVSVVRLQSRSSLGSFDFALRTRFFLMIFSPTISSSSLCVYRIYVDIYVSVVYMFFVSQYICLCCCVCVFLFRFGGQRSPSQHSSMVVSMLFGARLSPKASLYTGRFKIEYKLFILADED